MSILFVLESLLYEKDPQTKSLEGVIDPSLEIRILVSFCFYIHTLWCISLALAGCTIRLSWKQTLYVIWSVNVIIVWFQHACCPLFLNIIFFKDFWGLTDPQLDR